MSIEQMKHEILEARRQHFAQYGKDDWRIALYSDDRWGVGIVVKDVPLRTGSLKAGTVVCVQRRRGNDDFVTITHPSLMMDSTVEVKYVRPV
jgi:hypothetical protein